MRRIRNRLSSGEQEIMFKFEVIKKEEKNDKNSRKNQAKRKV